MKKFIALILIGVILSCTLSLPAFAFDNINQSDNLSVASVYGKSEEELSHFSSQLLEAMESNLYGAENVITEKSYFVLRKNNQTKEEEVISVTKEKYEQVISGTSISPRVTRPYEEAGIGILTTALVHKAGMTETASVLLELEDSFIPNPSSTSTAILAASISDGEILDSGNYGYYSYTYLGRNYKQNYSHMEKANYRAISVDLPNMLGHTNRKLYIAYDFNRYSNQNFATVSSAFGCSTKVLSIGVSSLPSSFLEFLQGFIINEFEYNFEGVPATESYA